MKLKRYTPYRRAALSCALAALVTAAHAAPIGYTYDSDERLTQVTYPDGRQITYAYDDAGNITAIATRNDSPPVVLLSAPLNGVIEMPVGDYPVALNRSAGVTGYEAKGLPAGMKINKGTVVDSEGKAPGVIYGIPTKSGVYPVQISARNSLGFGVPVTLTVTIENPFTAMAGGFDLAGNALVIIPSSDISGGQAGGLMSISISTSGGFSGKLILGAKKYSVQGQFDGRSGIAQVTIDRPAPLSDLLLDLTLVLKGDSRGAISGTLADGALTATLDGAASAWGPKRPATAFSGAKGTAYNIALVPAPAHAGDPALPKGAGFAAAKIKPAGAVQVVGKLADGTPFSAASLLSNEGSVPVSVSLGKGAGGLMGILTIDDSGTVGSVADNIVFGDLGWHRPGAVEGMTLNTSGGVYSPPARGFRVLELGAGVSHSAVSLQLSEGGLTPSIATAITVSNANKVIAFTPDSHAFSLTFTPASGLFSGKFTASPTPRPISFQGILLPSADGLPAQGYGFFLRPGSTTSDPVLSGNVLITP